MDAPLSLAELLQEIPDPRRAEGGRGTVGAVSLEGAVVTADAMFTPADFRRKIRKGGGDYLLAVKENQPTLLRDIEAVFALDAGCSPLSTAPV